MKIQFQTKQPEECLKLKSLYKINFLNFINDFFKFFNHYILKEYYIVPYSHQKFKKFIFVSSFPFFS